MGIGGSVMLLTGYGLAVSSLKGFLIQNYEHKAYGSVPDILAMHGAAIIVAAIPIAIAAKKVKRKLAYI